MRSIFRKLREVGFTGKDIAEIEYLSNPAVKKKVELILNRQIENDNFEDVITYFRTFADMLDEKQMQKKTLHDPELLVNVAKMNASVLDIDSGVEKTNEVAEVAS